MSQAPYMPVFTDALLGDTLHLSAEEFGAYCLILFATWRNNGQPLPDDDVELARVCRLSRQKWFSIKQKINCFFDNADGFWHQKRLEKEWAYVQQRIEINRKNGARGGRRKAANRNPSLDQKASDGGSDGVSNPDPYPKKEESPTPSLIPRSRARAAGVAPNGAHDGDGAFSKRLFAFEGTIVRVAPRDFAKWKASYHAIPDLTAELEAIDAKLVDEGFDGKWFSRVSGWLRAIHTTYLEQKTPGGSKGYAPVGSAPAAAGPPASPDWRHRMRIWFDEQHGGPTRWNWPEDRWGAPPGDPDCEVPQDVLAEFQKKAGDK